MSARRIVTLASVLTKSQLRAGRSGRLGERFFRSPMALLEIDAAVFAACAIVGALAAMFLRLMPEITQSQVLTSLGQALIFTPSLVPGAVVVAGILFELSVSSKFATSDSVNWLPIGKAEYVVASALSISYNYSVMLALILGFTVEPAAQFGLFPLWTAALCFSTLSIFLGGVIVEILRSTVNRIGNVMYRRARRGALALRLLVTIAVVLAFQLVFNIVFLVEIINSFSRVLSLTPFVPLFWASLAVKSFFDYNFFGLLIYGTASLAFLMVMLLTAIAVRSSYWSPAPVTFSLTAKSYKPSSRLLESLGMTTAEAALIRKDIKGLARRRDMLQYLAIPVVITVILLIQSFATRASGGPEMLLGLMPIWFVGGFFALMISSISFGQEGRAVTNLYSLPVSPAEVFKAKVVSVLVFSLSATLIISVLVSIVRGFDAQLILPSIVIAVLITLEETFIGLSFGTRFPDFQDRPRPRFVDPVGIILTALVGIGTILATAAPLIVREALVSVQAQVETSFWQFFILSIVFGSTITLLAYSLAKRGARRLLMESPS